MGMYNVLFGRNPAALVILWTLGLTVDAVGRFRDAFVSNGEIAVYTRNGGNNREDYMPDFSAHPNYLRDGDDDFDNTYATIYFAFPDEHRPLLERLETGKFDPNQRWMDYLERLKSGKEPVLLQVSEVIEKIKETLST